MLHKRIKMAAAAGLWLAATGACWAILGIPSYTPGSAITTNIKDAYKTVSWLADVDKQMTPQEGKSFDLGPGYYRFTIQSYCLHAGTYGPTKGDGYLIAPLKGDRAGLIRSILQRSADHPDIQQHDVQELIWGIEAGTKFSDYPLDFQNRVRPLLSPEEMGMMNVDIHSKIELFMPSELKRALGFYSDLRQKMADPNATFEDLERSAIKTGDAPWGKGSQKDVPPGSWTYAGDDFFIRAMPESYPTTVLEVLRPAPYHLERDDKGRITVFTSGDYRIDTSYDDTPGHDTAPNPDGGPDLRVWRFKSIKFSGPAAGDTETINDTGWMLRSDSPDNQASRPAGSRALSLASWKLGVSNGLRLTAGGHSAVGDLTDLKHYHDGLQAATNLGDLKKRNDWFKDHLNRVSNAWNYASCMLAGGNCDDNPAPKHFDPTPFVAAPANTAKQRLAMSTRTK